MTTLKQIKGQNVRVLATDPSPLLEGQLWYNSTSQTFKSAVLQPGTSSAWSSGGNLGTGRGSLGGAGTQNAGLAFTGFFGPPILNTEEYDGSTWTAGGNMSTARYNPGGAGTQTAALGVGGLSSGIWKTETEEYDGSTWTAGGNITIGRRMLGTAGTQTAGLAFGGDYEPTLVNGSWAPIGLTSTQQYDGTSWTAGGNLSARKWNNAGAGTQTAALNFGGQNSDSAVISSTEEYDGSTWTAGGNLTTARAAKGAGIQTAALAFSGYDGNALSTLTEEYNGTSWTAGGNIGTARYDHAGAGTQAAGLAFGGGGATSNLNATEEYTGGSPASTTVQTLTAS